MFINDPKTIAISKIREAYDLLELDPAGWTDTAKIEITPQHIVVTRHMRDMGGRKYLIAGEVASESVVVEIYWASDPHGEAK